MASTSLFECFRTVNQLRTLKDLMRHQQRWTPEINRARSLVDLGLDPKSHYLDSQLDEKINNLIPIVAKAAARARVGTTLRKQEREYDLFQNYEELRLKDDPTARTFQFTVAAIDRVVGVYKEARTRKLLGLLNPLRLIAHVIRTPITIIEYMGFDAEADLAMRILTYAIQVLWTVVLTLGATRLGIDIKILRALVE